MAAPDPLLDPPRWAPSWLPTIDDVARIRRFRYLVLALLVAGLGACVVRGADSPADPELLPVGEVPAEDGSTGPVGDGPVVGTGDGGTGDGGTGESGTGEAPSDDVVGLAEAVGLVRAELVDAAGEVLVLCLLDADQPGERSTGLMGVTDLSGVDGMLFTNEAERDGAFFMFRTLLPLTVGWWDDTGAFVGAADMVPCESDDSGECPRYPAPGPFRYGLEVVLGDPLADRFAGSTLVRTGAPCSLGTA